MWNRLRTHSRRSESSEAVAATTVPPIGDGTGWIDKEGRPQKHENTTYAIKEDNNNRAERSEEECGVVAGSRGYSHPLGGSKLPFLIHIDMGIVD